MGLRSINTISMVIGIVLISLVSLAVPKIVESMVVGAPSYARFYVDGQQQATSIIGEIYSDHDHISYNPVVFENGIYEWSIVEEFVASYATVLSFEIEKYPDLSAIGIDNIYVVENIHSKTNRQPILGFADTINGDIYLSQQPDSRAGTSLVRSTVHHEVAHMIFGTPNTSDWPEDAARYDYSQINSAQAAANYGFVSSYSEVSAAEDIAEIFAYIMTDSLSEELYSKSETDQLLDSKMDYVTHWVTEQGLGELLPR